MSDTPTELETLKARADQMGVTYHPAIGLDKLSDKVNAALSDETSEDAEDEEEVVTKAPTRAAKAAAIVASRAEAEKLVRINVTCMNQTKKEWTGDIFTTGNNQIGTYRKFVQFNTTDGFHVPNIIYQMIKAKKFQTFFNERTQNGVTQRRSKLTREYAIEVLDPLTQEELDQLAKEQAARG